MGWSAGGHMTNVPPARVRRAQPRRPGRRPSGRIRSAQAPASRVSFCAAGPVRKERPWPGLRVALRGARLMAGCP